MPAAEDYFDVLCYGTISLDSITRLPYLPTPRRDSQATDEYDTVGGEAFSVAIPLAAWGLRVLVTGNVIGTDWAGQFILSQVARFPNIDTRFVRQHANVTTPFSRICITPDGERTRIFYWYDDTPKVELTDEMMKCAAILSVDAYGRHERERAAMVARELKRPVISADALWPQYALASLSDLAIISKARLQASFPGVYEYDHSLDLQAQGAGLIIVTDGARPVLVVRCDGSAFGVEPYQVADVVDTSAAGHVFKAGIIYAWRQNDWALDRKVRFACAAAALSCQREHPAINPPSLNEIHTLLNSRFY